jgi:histone H2B
MCKDSKVNFDLYVRKALKLVHPNTGITKDAKLQLSSFIYIVGKRVVQEASLLTSGKLTKSKSKKKNVQKINPQSILQAIRLLFPDEIAKHAIAEGVKAYTRYSSSKEGTRDNLVTKAHIIRPIFPPSRVEKLIRQHHDGEVEKFVSIFLAGALQYVAEEFLELAGNASRNDKRVRIQARDILKAITYDEELLELTRTMNWRFKVKKIHEYARSHTL